VEEVEALEVWGRLRLVSRVLPAARELSATGQETTVGVEVVISVATDLAAMMAAMQALEQTLPDQ
jgi:hypothetical protein